MRAFYEFMEIMEEKFQGNFEFTESHQNHFLDAAAGTNLGPGEGAAAKGRDLNSKTSCDKTGIPGHFQHFRDFRYFRSLKFRGRIEFRSAPECPFYQVFRGFSAFSYENA